MHRLNYTIKLRSSAIISDFTKTKSEIFIPSNLIIGILGKKIFKKRNMKNIYDDDDFWNWLFNATIKIGNAFPSDDRYVYLPAPMNLEMSRDDETKIYNIFEGDNREKKNKINFPIAIENDRVFNKHLRYETNFHFGRRKDSSDKDIFYLEAIKGGTLFSGDIIGSKEELDKLVKLLGKSFPCRIGISKNTQYGSAFFEFKEIKVLTSTSIDTDCDIEFISNTLFYNENGMATSDVSVISKYFAELFNTSVEIVGSAIKTGIERRYIPHWKSDTISEQLVLPRSVIRLKLGDKVEVDSCVVGERQAQGFGRFKLISNMREYIGSEYNPDIRKPDKMPALTRAILTNFMDGKLEKSVINKALKDVKAFNIGSIPNSIIGNLLNSLDESFSLFKKSFEKKLNNEEFQLKLDRMENRKNTLDQHISKMNNYKFSHEINSLNIATILEGYKPSSTNKLLKTYWEIFFRYMMKSNGGSAE